MEVAEFTPIARRTFIAGAAATSVMALPGCASLGGLSLVDAIRRLLQRSASGALARLTAPGGFYDNELSRLDLPDIFGSRGNVLAGILTSAVFKGRLQRSLNSVAETGARRAAPIIADTVRTIGIDNAVALIKGGPTAATGFLRNAMAGSLIEAMVPALGDGLRLANDPIVGQAISALTGVDVTGVARSLSGKVDDAIWGEIGREESAIRANPQSTNDAVLIAALKTL
jgi:Protein of unknown function (DUF4197)